MHGNKVKIGQTVDLGFNVTVLKSGIDPMPQRGALKSSDDYKGWTVLDKAPSGVLSSMQVREYPNKGIWEHGSGHWWLMKRMENGETRFAICHARELTLSDQQSTVWSCEERELMLDAVA